MDKSPQSLAKSDKCEVCFTSKWRYKCPGCEKKTCSLSCSKSHKEVESCTGVRDKTRFVPLDKFTESHLVSDYSLLEDISRHIGNIRQEPTDSSSAANKKSSVPKPICLLLNACKRRGGPWLRLLPEHFDRRKSNTTACHVGDEGEQIFWKVQIEFVHVQQTVTLESVCERTKVGDLLSPYLETSAVGELEDDPFRSYKSAGFGQTCVLLKIEGVSQRRRYFELDVKKSLLKNLQAKSIVEHPIIYVIFTHHKDSFPTELEKQKKRGASHVKMSEEDNATEPHLASSEEVVHDPTSIEGSTFGLFSADLASSEDEESSGANREAKRKANQQKEQYKAKCLAEQSKEEEALKEHTRKVWKRSRQELDESSFLRSYVGEAGADHETEAQADDNGDPKRFKQYYDYYLQYYKDKYGVSADMTTSSGSAVSTSQAGNAPEQKKATALVSYGDSDSDSEQDE